MTKFTKTLFPLLLIVGTSVGCTALSPDNGGKWNPFHRLSADKASFRVSDEEPTSLAVIWKDSVYEKPGTDSVRGFGGRVFFYNGDNEPVQTEGELIVYGFDESNEDRTDAGADKKFVFKQKQFQQHFSETDLGPSYSVWIPWDKIGGYRKSITLIPVFKTASGELLRCGHSINVLPGKKPKETAETKPKPKKKSQNLVAQASFQNNASADEVATAKTRLRTTTLNVPPSLAKKLALAKQSQAQSARATAEEAKTSPRETNQTHTAFSPTNDSGSESKSETKSAARIFGVPGQF